MSDNNWILLLGVRDGKVAVKPENVEEFETRKRWNAEEGITETKFGQTTIFTKQAREYNINLSVEEVQEILQRELDG